MRVETFTPAPRIIGDHELLDHIDDYDLCPLYHARHLVTGHGVSIKLACPHKRFRSPRTRMLFEHQAQVLARIDHPHVIRLLGAGEFYDGRSYLITERLDGESLQRYLRAGPLPVARALRFARQLALGLRCIHEAGAIFRDVKPRIAMLFPDPHASDGYLLKIVDLTLVEIQDGSIARWAKGEMVGTPLYMSPEQIDSPADVDTRTDIYSFGVMLYEMLCGRRPFTGHDLTEQIVAILNQSPPPLRGVVDVPVELEAFVLGCMAKDRADRPSDMTQVIAALDRALAATVRGW
jgi:serine/threonine protein kinase